MASFVLVFFTFILILSLSYYIYTRVIGLTFDDIKAGHFLSKPDSGDKRMCKWGEWLPCETGTDQTRYEVYASDGDTDTFECSTQERKKETRECSVKVCTMEHMPVCACTEYDIDNVCQTHKTYGNRCEAGTALYTAGACENIV
jgi:hypothetical protein